MKTSCRLLSFLLVGVLVSSVFGGIFFTENLAAREIHENEIDEEKMDIPPPSDPQPEDGATEVDTRIELSVYVEHPEGSSMDVLFHDAFDDSLIGMAEDVQSGSQATTDSVDFAPSTEHRWYAVAFDGQDSARSDDWTFTTREQKPLPPTDPNPEDGAEGVSLEPEISVRVDHEAVRAHEETGRVTEGYIAPQWEADWRWLYEGEWRTMVDTALGNPDPGIWYAAARLDLSDDVGDAMTEIAYYNSGENANYIRGHVAEDEWGAPGPWLASTEQHVPSGFDWVELELAEPVNIEEPGEYWVVLEIDDLGEEHPPIGAIEPFVEEGGWLSVGDPHDPGSWDTLADQGEDYSWALEVKVHSDVFFDVEILDYDEEVMEGETVTVEYAIENTGEEAGTQDIELQVDGDVEDTETVSLAVGEEYTGDFSWIAADRGEYTLTVLSENDQEEVTVTVDHPSDFRVDIEGYDEKVGENEMVSVNYRVTNVGEEAGTQDIEFKVSGEQKDSRQLALDVDEESTGEFTWMPEEFGEFILTVSSDDDMASCSVQVLPFMEVRFYDASDDSLIGTVDDVASGERASITWEGLQGETTYEWYAVAAADDSTAQSDVWSFTSGHPSYFEVDITDYIEVLEGDEAYVDYEVTNTGEVEDNQDITFTVYHGEEVVYEKVEEDVAIEAGGDHDGSFTWQTEEGDAGEYEVVVATEDHEDEVTITVRERVFSVSILDYDDKVAEGEETVVEYSVKNTGDQEHTQDISFTVYDEEEDKIFEDAEETITLQSDETHEGEFKWQTEEGETGEYRLEVESEDSKADVFVSVLEAPIFDVELLYYSEEVIEGETFTIGYEITNTGGVQHTQTIELSIDGAVEETEEVTLGPGDAYEGEFDRATEEDDPGEYVVNISTRDREEGILVTVLQDAFFEVEIVSPTEGEEIAEGETVIVEYNITNTGDVEGTQEIVFSVDGERIDTTETTLAAGEAEEGQFRWRTGEGYSGEYDIAVATEDEEAIERGIRVIHEPGVLEDYWWAFFLLAAAGVFAVIVLAVRNKK